MPTKSGIVTATSLNLREEPSKESPLLATLPRGTRVKVL